MALVRNPIMNRITAYSAAITHTDSEIFDLACKMVMGEGYITEEPMRALLDRRMVLRMQLNDLRDVQREIGAQADVHAGQPL